MLEFVEGPLWYIAAAIFLAGSGWRLAGALWLGQRPINDSPRASPAAGAARSIIGYSLPGSGLSGNRNVQLLAFLGITFHLALFGLILFGPPHVAFIEARILGTGWATFPTWIFIVVGEIAFLSLLMLWIRRATDKVTRLISRRADHIAIGMTMAVIVTGCAALGENSVAMRVLHMASVEIWLIYFPFSPLFHAFTWVFSRAYTGAMFGRRGIRT